MTFPWKLNPDGSGELFAASCVILCIATYQGEGKSSFEIFNITSQTHTDAVTRHTSQVYTRDKNKYRHTKINNC